jgi:hypothetical protein
VRCPCLRPRRCVAAAFAIFADFAIFAASAAASISATDSATASISATASATASISATSATSRRAASLVVADNGFRVRRRVLKWLDGGHRKCGGDDMHICGNRHHEWRGGAVRRAPFLMVRHAATTTTTTATSEHELEPRR